MAEEPITEQVVQSGIVTAIEFDIMSSAEMEKYSSFTLSEKDDVSHPKLGLPNSLQEKCATCGSKDVRDCNGHFGVINLPATIYHPYFIAEVVQILNQICPSCLSLKQDFEKGTISFEVNDLRCDALIKAIRNNFSRAKKKINLDCVKTVVKRKKSNCKYCVKSSVKWYPMMRFKVLSRDLDGRRSLQIMAEIAEKQLPKRYQNRGLDEVLAGDFWEFVPRDVQQQEPNKLKITLTPYQAFTLLKKLDKKIIESLISKRDWIFLSSIPVTANNHRVSETYRAYADGPLLAFDERTKAYKKIIDSSKKIDELRQHAQFKARAGSHVTTCTMECLNASKLHSRQQSNGERTPAPGASHGVRWLKDVLLSKRSDHVFRMVMVGDPKVKLSEIGINAEVARNLLITEHINSYNLEKLRSIFEKCFITKQIQARRDGKLITLKKNKEIQIGDIVYRPVQNGDIILINRPPSVHQHSLIGLTVKILPTENVLSINPVNCIPLLGDFDGDCLHGYVPQSLACRAELSELVSIDNQLFNSQDGRSLVSLSHDSLLAAYLLTKSDTYLSKYKFQQLEMFCLTQSETVPNCRLWTGLQLFSSCLNGADELVSPSTSQWLKGGKSGIFYHIFRRYGKKGLEHLFRAQETLCEFLTMRGLTVSLSDLYLSPNSNSRKILQQEVRLAIEEAEDSLKCKELVLNPDMMPVSMSYDYKQEDFTNLFSDNLSIKKISIGAFKDVFSNLTKLASLHANKGNSILEMISSGSKMNLAKLVHQTLCLGLQLPVRKFPFTIPSDLNCVSWNNHKAMVEPGQSSLYVVIRSSFLDGLNPLECLLHSISARANFSDNAEVPGTLNREMMYYLRDIYTSYDGSVRDAYGQIVQFSYGDDDDRDVVGAPVGAWAASAVSEAAYGALDCPVGGLEQSPLMNLKKVLKCDKSGATDHAAVMYLSSNVQKCKYGCEYAALLIQSHLEPVVFSDLVNVVMILYGGREAKGFRNSPWEVHFHLNEDIMKRKRISLNSVKSRLVTNYEIKRKSEGKLPALRIFERSCSSGDDGSYDDLALCLVVAAESSDLDLLKLKVIPLLLRCLAKGFEEFKHIEIKCMSGELFLRVTMSDACASGHFWATLQNACTPIVDLIDWTRSQPDTIQDVFGVLGIDSAWTHFLTCLKGSISDIGREIQKTHLITMADSLSVSGKFHGLSSNGLKLQRKRLGLSAPFSQACFSGPATTFVTAAKERSVDGLRGSLDSVSWGKEPSIGSGGHFDLIFPVKEDEPKEYDDMYKFLNGFLPNETRPSRSCSLVNGEAGPPSYRHEVLHGYADKKTTQLDLPPEYRRRSIGNWANILDMHASLQNILHQYPIETCVSATDRLSLIEALLYHPRRYEKIGIGVKAIKVGLSHGHDGSRCFILIRNNDSEEDFSYRKCILGAAASISPELKILVETKLFRKVW
ncbi:DNA-directed RNA polymerase IV subunit 1 [Carex littledalei]|uniref:DNA-directed RNA polymerase subunit n=1 Tax=Carex littledalei TaxID=544730 RepID=A0A833RWL0_9POAL|nr:DNA-directed RNA polymerase IV subunit 1 [Carex littledalei]